MKRIHVRTKVMCATLLLAFSWALGTSPVPGQTRGHRGPARIYGHIPERAIARSEWRGRVASDREIPITFVLPLRNADELRILLSRIYDRTDPLYGRYLTPQQFAERFAPTQADYDTVAGYAQNLGFMITGRHPNRTLLDVSAPAAAVESGFSLRMHRYGAPSGREFYAPDDEPAVPDVIASRVVGVIGLENAHLRHPYSTSRPPGRTHSSPRLATGPDGGLSPQDVAKAYNLENVAADGSGETLAVFSLDGYRESDIAEYVRYFGLQSVPLQNILVDDFSGRPGRDASEVTLDIELLISLAPGARSIMVYEGPNSNAGILHTYNRIATDNAARQISTSWGLSELDSSQGMLVAENAIFQQMAAQGQTIYAASGDSGAYDNGSLLSVDDPCSQPYVVATGGTTLFLNDGSNQYDHETTWNFDDTIGGGASGGGISSLWEIPYWQQKFVPAGSLASGTMRNVPDVALNSDPETGYSVYYHGVWHVFGGTSCAAPLWAAYTARVNQQRISSGMPPLGFASPTLYEVAGGSRYGADFHDISDGTTNLYYSAVSGYDNATGWGSFNGFNLLSDLAGRISLTGQYMPRYYNALGQPYTNEDVAYWQTADGLWWRGDRTGAITLVGTPPWLTRIRASRA